MSANPVWNPVILLAASAVLLVGAAMGAAWVCDKLNRRGRP